MKRLAGFVLCVQFSAVIGLLATGCGQKPTQATGDTPPNGATTPPAGSTPPVAAGDDLLTAKADLVMTPAEMNAAMRKDGMGYVKQNNGKIVEMTGVISKFDYGLSGALLFFKDGGQVGVAGNSAVAHGLPGQTVTLRARVVVNKGIVDAVLVKATGNPPPTTTAEQFSKELAANAEELEKKYGRYSYLIVTGTISAIKAEPGFEITLTPEGVKPPITCSFGKLSDGETERNTTMKVGQKVRVIGTLRAYAAGMDSCDLLPEAK